MKRILFGLLFLLASLPAFSQIYGNSGGCTNNCTFTGATAINAGSLAVSSAAGVTAVPLSVSSGGASVLSVTASTTNVSVGSGTGLSQGMQIANITSGRSGLCQTGVTCDQAHSAILLVNGANAHFTGGGGGAISLEPGGPFTGAGAVTLDGTNLSPTANNSVSLGTYGAAYLGLAGTNTNNSAAAGFVGEFISFSVASSGAVVTLSSNTPTTVVSTGATVTAGDYDAEGITCYISGATTSFTVYKQGINTATNAFGALGSYFSSQFAAMVPLATTVSENCQITPRTRISLSGTSNIFMVAAPVFSISGTITAYGFLRLRRVR